MEKETKRNCKGRGITGTMEALGGRSEESFAFGFALTLRTIWDNSGKEKWAKVNKTH